MGLFEAALGGIILTSISWEFIAAWSTPDDDSHAGEDDDENAGGGRYNDPGEFGDQSTEEGDDE